MSQQSHENHLHSCGLLKNRCSEAIVFPCTTCGETFLTTQWQESGNECPACGEGTAQNTAICATCQKEIPGVDRSWQGGEHACQSVEVFRETGRCVFDPSGGHDYVAFGTNPAPSSEPEISETVTSPEVLASSEKNPEEITADELPVCITWFSLIQYILFPMVLIVPFVFQGNLQDMICLSLLLIMFISAFITAAYNNRDGVLFGLL